MADDQPGPAKKLDELNDEQLDKVSGGINPQPLPPGRHQPPPPPSE